MPALLSPRSSPAAVATAAAAMTEGEDTKTLKKKKSVMMRLKSKISNTLSGGKKKSFVGDTSPTDNDVLKKLREFPETTAMPQHEKRREADGIAHSQQESEAVHRDSSYAEKEDTSVTDDTSVMEAAIEPFDATLVDDEYDDDHDEGSDTETALVLPVSAAMTVELIQPKNHLEHKGDEEVFASDYKTSMNNGGPQEEVYDDRFDDDADYEEDKLEVFHESSASAESLGNQTSVTCEHDVNISSKHHQQEEDEERGPETGPGRLDLVVVGMSPLKTMRGGPPPVSSPVKKGASSPIPKPAPSRATSPGSPRSELSAKPVEPSNDQQPSTLAPKAKPRGGIKVDFPQEDNDNGNKGNDFTRERPVKMKAPPQFSSAPVRRSFKKVETSSVITQQALLSDFQFGSAESSATAIKEDEAKGSPAKRRGAITKTSLSPPMRKSLPRDHESHVMGHGAASAASSSQMPPSPKTKKTRTGLSSTFKQSESSLQGIQEEQSNKAATTTTEDRPVSPRKMTHEPSTHRRSSCTMDAPILASAFVTSTYPESHDEQQQHGITPIGEEIKDETDVVGDGSSSSGAFAFDAGAAITQEFGERVARLLGADPWGDRQDGFDAIMYIVKKADLASAKNKRELFCAALAAIQCGVDDRVAPVMYCALECLRAVLKEFAPVIDRTFVKYAPTNEQLSALVKSLTAKLGDSNKRTQREVSQALIRVAKQKKLKSLPHVLLHLSAKEVAPRIQVATLRQLVSELDVDSKYGLSLDVVMQFAVPALKIADEKTRKAAVELIADLQMNNPNGGAAVTAQLVGIKPEMLRVINRRVEELVAQREKEQQAAQSTNQSEEAHGAGGDDGDLDDQRALELVSVPLEDAKKVIAMIDFQLQQAAGVIGPVAWRKLESKTWSDRKEALVDIDKLMADAKSDLRDARPAFGSVIQQNFLAYCITVHKCLADSIAPVVNSAMDCLSTLIKVFGPFVEWREESVRDVVLLTIMRLFSTMQKPNNRTNRAACRSILKFARLTNAHTLRYTLSCIFAKETDALVQMHLLRLLIPEFGFQQDGISAAMVLAAVGSALVHANEKVRKTAIDVALCTQRLVGKEYVLKKLKDVKAVTLKELEKNFVDCDVKKDGDRPQTVNGSSSEAGGLLPPVSFASDQSRRLLNSAPVGVGKLQCTPPGVDEDDQYSSSGHRRASVLSNDEENLMDAILDGGDF